MSRADFSLHHVWQIITQALSTKFIRTWTSISIAFVSCMPACELSLMMKPSIPVPDNWDNSKPAFSSLVTNYDRNRPFTLSIKIGSDRSFEQCRATIEKAGWRFGLRQISHCWMKLKRSHKSSVVRLASVRQESSKSKQRSRDNDGPNRNGLLVKNGDYK